MKKFFKKKAVMFGSIVAAAVVLVLLVAFCVRPVSVGYTYKNYNEDLKTTSYMKIKTFDKMVSWSEVDGKETDKNEYWYFVKDGAIVSVPVSAFDEEAWEKFKEESLEHWDEKEAKENGAHINAFSIKYLEEGKEVEEFGAYKCAGAVATVVVLAVLEVALLGAVAYAVLVSKKK